MSRDSAGILISIEKGLWLRLMDEIEELLPIHVLGKQPDDLAGTQSGW
jgi:hypothetical protein